MKVQCGMAKNLVKEARRRAHVGTWSLARSGFPRRYLRPLRLGWCSERDRGNRRSDRWGWSGGPCAELLPERPRTIACDLGRRTSRRKLAHAALGFAQADCSELVACPAGFLLHR